MLLSIITVAFRNLEGIVKHTPRWRIWRRRTISTSEWIVADGVVPTTAPVSIWKILSMVSITLRFVSEPDNGIYDAMNKGIEMAQGKFAVSIQAIFFHQDAANFGP